MAALLLQELARGKDLRAGADGLSRALRDAAEDGERKDGIAYLCLADAGVV